MEVSCYEGKVKVTGANQLEQIITANQSCKIAKDSFVPDWKPSIEGQPTWITGESTFHDANLQHVLNELSVQFDLKVNVKADISNRTYSGYFEHSSIQEAAKSICLPMGLSFEIKGDSVLIIE